MKIIDALEAIKTIGGILSNKPLGRICRIIKYIAGFLLIISYIGNYYNMLDLKKILVLPRIPGDVIIVGNYLFWISLIIWLLYNMARKGIAKAFMKLFHDAPQNNYKGLSFYFYIGTIIDLIFSIIFLLYALGMFVEGMYSRVVDYWLVIGCVLYLAKCILHKIYYKHQIDWEERFRNYSGYCDANQKELYENCKVVYKGKIYKVAYDTNKEWVIQWKKKESISLEDVVQDKENAIFMVEI